jgi:hypothetical protein
MNKKNTGREKYLKSTCIYKPQLKQSNVTKLIPTKDKTIITFVMQIVDNINIHTIKQLKFKF